jgi:hypothetical protein
MMLTAHFSDHRGVDACVCLAESPEGTTPSFSFIPTDTFEHYENT